MDVSPLTVDVPTSVTFRALYSGRFPMHFHGKDGSHFEVVVFEIG